MLGRCDHRAHHTITEINTMNDILPTNETITEPSLKTPSEVYLSVSAADKVSSLILEENNPKLMERPYKGKKKITQALSIASPAV